MEAMCNVEKPRIHVRHLCVSQKPLRIDRLRRLHNSMEFSLQLHCASRPHRPMSKQTGGEPKRVSGKSEFGEQVQDNVVVVARVESNLACAAGCSYPTQNILGCIAIEGSNLDPDHAFDLCERPPKLKRKRPAADSRLKVKANDGNDLSNRAH